MTDQVDAIRVHEVGGPHVLRHEALPPFEPGSGEVVLRLEAIGVNYIDVHHRSGRYPRPLPFTPGGEGCGVVVAIGQGVDGCRPGDRAAVTDMVGRMSGTYATDVLATAESLIPVPAGLEGDAAASGLYAGLTAHVLATTVFPLREGQVCLVHSAAGGVGQLLVQIAKQRGARVIAFASNEDKAAIAAEVGADVALTYSKAGSAEAVKAEAGGAGVDVVFDAVGADTFELSLASLRPTGLLVLYGEASGPVPPFETRRLRELGSLFLTRVNVSHYLSTSEDYRARGTEVLQLLSAGQLSVRIDSRFTLDEAAEAHRRLEGRAAAGKILLIPERAATSAAE